MHPGESHPWESHSPVKQRHFEEGMDAADVRLSKHMPFQHAGYNAAILFVKSFTPSLNSH
jgi:hypothetical protein